MAIHRPVKNSDITKKIYSFKIARCQNPIKKPADVLKMNDGWWLKSGNQN